MGDISIVNGIYRPTYNWGSTTLKTMNFTMKKIYLWMRTRASSVAKNRWWFLLETMGPLLHEGQQLVIVHAEIPETARTCCVKGRSLVLSPQDAHRLYTAHRLCQRLTGHAKSINWVCLKIGTTKTYPNNILRENMLINHGFWDSIFWDQPLINLYLRMAARPWTGNGKTSPPFKDGEINCSTSGGVPAYRRNTLYKGSWAHGWSSFFWCCNSHFGPVWKRYLSEKCIFPLQEKYFFGNNWYECVRAWGMPCGMPRKWRFRETMSSHSDLFPFFYGISPLG